MRLLKQRGLTPLVFPNHSNLEQRPKDTLHLRTIQRLADFCNLLTSESDDVFEFVVRILSQVMEVPVVCLSQVVGNELHFRALCVEGEVLLHAGKCPLNITPCATVTKDKEIRVYDRVQELFPEAAFLRDQNARSYCGIPALNKDGEVIAVICLLDDKKNDFLEVHHNVFRVIGQRIAIEIEQFQYTAERKKYEEQLTNHQRFNQFTIDSLPLEIVVLDANGVIVTSNSAWREFARANDISWKSVSEGTNYLSVCDRAAEDGDDDAPAVARGIRDVIAGKEKFWHLEYSCHSPSTQRWYFCHVTRFLSQNDVYVVVAHENITDMRLAQRELTATIARYDSLKQVSPVGIGMFDTAGKCIDVNRQWYELTGISCENALGDDWLTAIHTEDREQVLRLWDTSLQGSHKFSSEHRLLPKNGNTVWVFCQAEPITNSLGKLTGFVLTMTDVTRQKQTEQALRLLSSSLASLNGAEFYHGAVSQLAELVECDIAFICRPDPEQPGQFVTLAMFADGEIQTNFSYPIAGTPCENVVAHHNCIISSGAAEKYPKDVFLIDHQINAYVGVPFSDSRGHQFGHIGVMSRQPLQDPKHVETIVHLFAVSVLAEIERQTSERRFTDLFEYSPDAIVLIDRNGIIVQANREVNSLFGWSQAELIGQLVEILMPPDLRVGHPSLRKRYVESALPRAMGSGRARLFGMRKDGDIFPVDISLSPIESPEGLLVAAAVRDVSERHRVDVALQEANVFADAIIENVSGLFYVFGMDGIYVRWNQALQELLGLSPDQMRQTNVLSTVHEADRERVAEKISEVFVTGYAENEARLLLKNGTRQYLLSARRSEINGVIYLVGSGADITDRKDAEERIILLNQTLEQRVQLRTEELATANSELLEASRAKSEFLATMSHELRTPLNGILGMNELLLKTQLGDRQRQYVNACASSGKILVQLINDILDLSKIEAGKLELDPHECDIEVLVFDVVDIMSSAIREKGLGLHCHFAENACMVVLCDDTRLRQVLVNMVGNAIKFTSTGSITISVEQIAQQDQIARLRFAVVDTGIGIPTARLDRLFKAFSQVDSSTTRQFGGTGLGLSICRQLVELMGGKIGIESKVGVGSTFWFEIDVVTVENNSISERRRRSLEGTQIIVIDGLDRERQHLSECLQNWNCPCLHVATVDEALAVVRSTNAPVAPFQVVLADCRLVAGDEFAQLQKLAAIPELHIIGIGSVPNELSRERLQTLGVRHVLSDPIRPHTLFDALASVLSVENPDAEVHLPPPQQLLGHILVAEDNTINQLYIVEMLRHLGCTCDLAVNGEEAVAAVEHKSYDLILMDCQMPEMDGFAATREIRNRESSGQLSGRRPIVALTANTVKGDREKCLATGMDDYISKPVDVQQLRAIIERYLSSTSPPQPTNGEDI